MFATVVFAFTSLVAGETCPAPVDVEARVRAILHLAAEQQLSEGFVVERHESGLYVELRSADSTLIGQRTLPAEGSCDELAQAAAVVLSAWLNDAHPDFASALPPAPAPEPAPAPVPEPAPAPPPPKAAPPPVPPRAPSRQWELGVAGGVDLSDGSFGPAAFVVSGFVPVAGGFGLSGVLGASWSRQLSLGPGEVAWRRWPLGAGPSFRVATPSVSFDVNAGPALAWLHLDGSKFEHTSTQEGVEFGGLLNLRVASRGRRAGVFALVSGQYYPLDSGAYASSEEDQWFAPVPRFSLGLALGAWLLP